MFPPAGAFVQKISIHALREEGDPTVAAALQAKTEFLSTPSARRATERYGERVMSDKFLSTPSARRATSDGRCPSVPARNFYPRPPRGGRLNLFAARHITGDISIHALREEGDLDALALFLPIVISIHALREEGDGRPANLITRQQISIHALREEGDLLQCLFYSWQSMISIHALREEGDA